jgi:low temperature requirement protein LtrA
MKGIEVPERTEDFTADPVELFFDLAYVFAFSQLVGFLVHHPDWTGIGQVALVFWLLWLPWSQFTWSANAVSGNGRAVRAVFLIGTAVSVPMAASVSTAFDDGGPVFSISLAMIVLLGIVTLVLSIENAPETKDAVVLWVAPSFAAIAVIIVGGFVDGRARVWVWLAATFVVLVGMALAGRNEWVIRPGHFAERHGLIIIIALGEVIVAIGAPVAGALGDGAGLVRSTALALIGVGAFAGLTWWSYFDRVSPALEHRARGLTGTLERGRYARDVYTLAHALMVAGIILTAAALEDIALHPSDHVEANFRWMLFGGLGLLTAGTTVAIWRAFQVIPRERVVAMALVGIIVAISASWDGWVLIAVIDLLIAATLVAEHVRIEK